MKLQHSDQQMSTPGDALEIVGVIAEALRAKFGGDALAVAQLQAEQASSESGAQWREVVRSLSA